MSVDHEAIFKAYPDCVSSDDSAGAFKAVSYTHLRAHET